MKVYIGYDEREDEAYQVARASLLEVTNSGLEAEALDVTKLSAQGLLNRVSDQRGGQDYDLVSNGWMSTRFAVSRFLVPLLCQQGFALFTDCDVVFREDPRNIYDELLTEENIGKAVHVVKHNYESKDLYKMVGQRQSPYPRKNWSSVMLFNCDHPANRRLSLRDVNERPGRDLHQFYWLNDDEIGELDPRWNWLVGEQEQPRRRGIAHFTLGGPWIPGWHSKPHDELWLDTRDRLVPRCL